jgi:hypothetical protein
MLERNQIEAIALYLISQLSNQPKYEVYTCVSRVWTEDFATLMLSSLTEEYAESLFGF